MVEKANTTGDLEERAEAERLGQLYSLVVEGEEYVNPQEGELFGADSLEEALRDA